MNSIEELKKLEDNGNDYLLPVRVFKIIKRDLERLEKLEQKETPQKVVWKKVGAGLFDTTYYAHCPNCDEASYKYDNAYCARCGQKLDWNDEDEY